MEIRTPNFSDYFEYISRQARSLEMADKWLLEKFSDIQDPDSLSFMELAKLMGQFKSKNSSVSNQMPTEVDGHIFDFTNPRGSVYWAVANEVNKSIPNGLKVAVYACYSCDGMPVKECESQLNFYHAELLAKHFMSFFTGA